MIFWIIVGILAIVVILLLAVFPRQKFRTVGYEYKKRDYIMSQSEQRCFDILTQVIGQKYHIFPQIHLPTFLDHKINGQSWNGAFRHIDEKSVDFVLCDKITLSPKLAVELDDRSHERPDRRERDREVERILKDANMPLLRLKDNFHFDRLEDLVILIDSTISASSPLNK